VPKPSERTLDMITRLGWEIPLTLWPSLFLIRAQGTYSTGRHSAEALHAVAGLALGIASGLTAFGILLVMCGKRDAETRIMAIMAIVIHYFLICGFISGSAVAYT